MITYKLILINWEVWFHISSFQVSTVVEKWLTGRWFMKWILEQTKVRLIKIKTVTSRTEESKQGNRVSVWKCKFDTECKIFKFEGLSVYLTSLYLSL